MRPFTEAGIRAREKRHSKMAQFDFLEIEQRLVLGMQSLLDVRIRQVKFWPR
jgi:hypothetical protein